MQVFLLTALTMTAFAANSVLTRMGVATFDTDPLLFALVRVIAGIVMLWLLIWRGAGAWPEGTWRTRWLGAASLALYMAGFSLAYLTLDTGVGALILFGGVQITMFAGAVLGGERLSRARIAGAVIALAGLAVLVWPSEGAQIAGSGIALMLAAALGWGVYSLLGRSETTPLPATGANFLLCLPMLIPLFYSAEMHWSLGGLALAVLAGAVTSGLGYALWYRVMPMLGATLAAMAQLTVPVIAALAGVVFLDEALGWRFVLACVLILGGIALSQRKF